MKQNCVFQNYNFEYQVSILDKRSEFIKTHLHLVEFIVDKMVPFVPSFLTRDDLVGAAMNGLIEAANRFDPGKEVLFKTFAEHRMRGAIFDEVRKMDWFSRSLREKQSQLTKVLSHLEKKLGRSPEEEEIAEAMNLSLNNYRRLLSEVGHLGFVSLNETLSNSQEGQTFLDALEDTEAVNPQEYLEYEEMTQILASQLEKLSEKERLVVSLFYYEDITQKEIAEVMGLTEGRISQLHSQAIHKLKIKMQQEMLKE